MIQFLFKVASRTLHAVIAALLSYVITLMIPLTLMEVLHVEFKTEP